jgi:hypothetical protein
MVGPAKINAINSIFDEGLSCETFREREARRLMKLGTYNFNIKKAGKNEIWLFIAH